MVRLSEASPKGQAPGWISGWLVPAFVRMLMSTPETNGCVGPGLSRSLLETGPALCWNVQTQSPFWSKGNPFFGLQIRSVLFLVVLWHFHLLPLSFLLRGTREKTISYGPEVCRSLITHLHWGITPYLFLEHRKLSIPTAESAYQACFACIDFLHW